MHCSALYYKVTDNVNSAGCKSCGFGGLQSATVAVRLPDSKAHC